MIISNMDMYDSYLLKYGKLKDRIASGEEGLEERLENVEFALNEYEILTENIDSSPYDLDDLDIDI